MRAALRALCGGCALRVVFVVAAAAVVSPRPTVINDHFDSDIMVVASLRVLNGVIVCPIQCVTVNGQLIIVVEHHLYRKDNVFASP